MITIIHWIALKLTAFLKHQNALNHPSVDIYIYGLESAVYTFLSTTALLYIGYISSYSLESLLLIIQYYSNQSLGGGYHASTHIRCFLTMVLGMLAFILSMSLPHSHFLNIVISLLSLLILWKLPVVLHPNKRYLLNKASTLVRHSRNLVLFQFTILFLCSIKLFPPNIVQAFTIGSIFSCVSRLKAATLYKDLVVR